MWLLLINMTIKVNKNITGFVPLSDSRCITEEMSRVLLNFKLFFMNQIANEDTSS